MKIVSTEITTTFEDGSRITTFMSEQVRQHINESKKDEKIVGFADGSHIVYIPSQKENER